MKYYAGQAELSQFHDLGRQYRAVSKGLIVAQTPVSSLSGWYGWSQVAKSIGR
jgi:hypothetical protein